MTSLKKENTVLGIIFMVLSVYYGYLTSQLQFRKAAQGMGPDSMPYIFAAALFVLSIFLIIEGYVKNTAAANKNPLGLKMILGPAVRDYCRIHSGGHLRQFCCRYALVHCSTAVFGRIQKAC
jgi:hypothetical protein